MEFVHHIISGIIDHPITLLTVALSVILVYVFYLDHKIVTLTRGKSGSSLEEIIVSCVEGIARVEKQNTLINTNLSFLDTRIKTAIRNAKTIRYKAYDANGSNQSFSLALVNEEGDGVVISSLHSRDRMSTFAKPLKNYKSTYELTEEEIYVITEAKEDHIKGLVKD